MLRRMRALVIITIFLAACKREMPPRDYQNNPPAMTHPVTSSAKSPSAAGMKGAAPEPDKGVEGKNTTRKPTDPSQATTTLKDQAPSTATH